MELKKLTTPAKYDAIIEFCEANKKLPYYKSKNKNERKMRAFLVNKWNKQKRFDTEKSDFGLLDYEIKQLKVIASYKESMADKLNIVLDYCEEK